MPLRVVCFCAYPSGLGEWRQRDYDAYKFVQALKGRTINGYATIPVSGTDRRLEDTNRGDAVDWFGEMAATYLAGRDLPNPFVLVPLPNSACSIRSTRVPTTLSLARSIARHVVGGQAHVSDCLRFKVAMPSAHQQGGTRNPKRIRDNLTVTSRMKGRSVIIVDDVLTSGGHLKAAADALRDAGATVLMATCAGRAVWERRSRVFGLIAETLEDL